MVLETLLLPIVCVLTIVYFLRYIFQSFIQCVNRVPRVQWCLPFIGNAYQINMQRCHLVFENWAKVYGPVFEVKLYNESIVVLNDYNSIYEALVKSNDAFAGRPKMYRTQKDDRSHHSIVWQTLTPKLVFLRKEVIRSLKAYGEGLDKLEKTCAQEIGVLLDRIRSYDKRAFVASDVIRDSVTGVMISLLLGRRLGHGSPECETIKQIGSQFNKVFNSGTGKALDVLPWLRLLGNGHHQKLQRALTSRDTFWQQYVINNHIADDSVIGGMLQLTLSVTNGIDITEQTAKEVFTNLTFAGTDTTTTALACLLIIVLHDPEVQTRIQKEIDDCQPDGDPIRLAHKDRLPYTQAVILETLRFIAHVPLAIPHCTMSDVKLMDYLIPRDTTVYINIWAAHHDPSVWPNPHKFDPNRFLDDCGNLVSPSHPNRKRLLVFGAGRRVCLGEAQAKNTLFLFVTSMFQKFTFLPDDLGELPEADPRHYTLGIDLHPEPFKIRAVERHFN